MGTEEREGPSVASSNPRLLSVGRLVGGARLRCSKLTWQATAAIDDRIFRAPSYIFMHRVFFLFNKKKKNGEGEELDGAHGPMEERVICWRIVLRRRSMEARGA